MKTSTLIIIVESITPTHVTYTSRTDISSREYKHYIPRDSKFPFERLTALNSYALISIQLNQVWYWYIAHDLTDSITLKDNHLEII